MFVIKVLCIREKRSVRGFVGGFTVKNYFLIVFLFIIRCIIVIIYIICLAEKRAAEDGFIISKFIVDRAGVIN